MINVKHAKSVCFSSGCDLTWCLWQTSDGSVWDSWRLSGASPGPTLKRLISYICELYLMCKYLESTTAAKRFRSLEVPGKLQCTILRHSSSQNVGRDPPKPKPHPTSLNSLVSRLSCSLYDYCCCSCDRKKHFSCQNCVYFVLFWVKYQIILLLLL